MSGTVKMWMGEDEGFKGQRRFTGMQGIEGIEVTAKQRDFRFYPFHLLYPCQIKVLNPKAIYYRDEVDTGDNGDKQRLFEGIDFIPIK
jgi:hypothetical protein